MKWSLFMAHRMKMPVTGWNVRDETGIGWSWEPSSLLSQQQQMQQRDNLIVSATPAAPSHQQQQPQQRLVWKSPPPLQLSQPQQHIQVSAWQQPTQGAQWEERLQQLDNFRWEVPEQDA